MHCDLPRRAETGRRRVQRDDYSLQRRIVEGKTGHLGRLLRLLGPFAQVAKPRRGLMSVVNSGTLVLFPCVPHSQASPEHFAIHTPKASEDVRANQILSSSSRFSQ